MRKILTVLVLMTVAVVSCFAKDLNLKIQNISRDPMIVIAQNENGDWIWNRWVEIPAGKTVSIHFTDLPTNKVTIMFDTEATDTGLGCKKGYMKDFEIENEKSYKMSYAFGSGFKCTVKDLKK